MIPKNPRIPLEFRTILVAVLFLVGCQTVPSTSADGLLCIERTTLVDQLKAKPKSIGLAANGSVLEILTAKSGTWSIIVTEPSRTACLIWFGGHWQDIKQQTEKEDL